MRFFLDLEAQPPPMTHGEKLVALPSSKCPKAPKAPVHGKVPKGWKDKQKIADKEATIKVEYAAASVVYQAAMDEYDALEEAAAEAYWLDLAKNPLKAEITVIGWAVDDGPVQQHSGPAAIHEFADAIGIPSRRLNMTRGAFLWTCDWVTFSGGNYDFPLLWRALAQAGYPKLRDAIPRYGDRNRDLQELQSWPAHRRRPSLNDTAQGYLGTSKPGSNPAADWVSGDPERRAAVLERNLWDVATLQQLAEIML